MRLTPPGRAAAALARTPFDAIQESWLDCLDETLRFRGPDGQGRFRDRAVRGDGGVVDVALVHRRLSIIDHNCGAQPMVSQAASGTLFGHRNGPLLFQGGPREPVNYQPLPDHPDTLAVVFNGCIYNHRELRKELECAGHRFTTDHSDTEVLLHGWRQWGAGVPDRSDGTSRRTDGLTDRLEDMFAFAIWDRRTASLSLARDQYGQKPLYTTRAEYGGDVLLAFCSAVPGLILLRRALGQQSPSVSKGLVRWLRFGADGHLPLDGVQEVPPSSVVLSDMGSWSNHTYLNFHIRERMNRAGCVSVVDPSRTHTLTEEETEQLLRKSVACRAEADVPVGCYLSGGVDSSLIAAFARECIPDLQTFTVQMPVASHDESVFAHEAARLLGTRHQTLACTPDPAADLQDLIQRLGLPFGDSSLLPSYWLAREVRRAAPVALCGDGGDELFGGYERYHAAALLRARSLLSLWPGSAGPDPRSRRSRLHRLADAARHDGYRDLRSVFPTSALSRLLPPSTVAEAFARERSHGRTIVGAGAAMNDDLHTYLPDDLMRKSDTASMHVSIEVRSPFLDPALSATARAALLTSLMPRGQRKGLLRAVARRHLPAHIVDRPKMGFAIPIGDWLRSDYGGLRTLLLDHVASTEPFGPPSLGIDVNMSYVRRMLDEHLGTSKSSLVMRDHSQRLYMLLVLSIWARQISRPFNG